jgi:glycosyltransferase involved in cell wall biosynthesis
MPDELRRIVAAGIIPIGYVASLTEIFDRVRLTVAPLAYGAGVKGKVIESLSAGIPCVCTPIAAEGLDLPSVLRAHIDEHADAIAASIVRLHTDESENESCRCAGLEFVRKQYSDERLDAAMRQATGLV